MLATAVRFGATLIAGGLVVASLAARQQPPAVSTPPSSTPLQQPNEVAATITTDRGAQVRIAVPDFIALSPDKETADAAKVIARVLWDDLNFEHEYAFIPRDVTASVPAAKSVDDINYDAWRELNTDAVVLGTVQKTSAGVRVEMRLFNVRQRQSDFGNSYEGSIANPRIYAHTIADEIHHRRALNGVARTRLTFASDRDGDRLSGTVENRGAKEIYISDYDGENQRRITVGFALNISPTWSPDTRSIAYTSYKQCTAARGCIPGLPNIFVQHIYEGVAPEELTANASNNFLPVWSPDGTRIAFASNRDQAGGFDIYVMNRDGSNVKRLTTSRPGVINITPTWSPTGNQIAFTSDRTGSKQIWTMEADGLSQRQLTHEDEVDRSTWSPAPYNEIAYAAKSSAVGFDIKILEVATLKTRLLTDGLGSNESPAFSPNGRHIAFTSTRAGKSQIFTINRTGQDLKQITRLGNNTYPNWSNGPIIKDN
jgi:TolB protein